MKKPRKALIVTLAVASGLVVGGSTMAQSQAGLDMMGIEQTLQRHDEQLANHDDRIKNTEKDVSDVQDSTKTPPSPDKVPVREVTTPAPTSTEPLPVAKVISFKEVPVNDSRTDCEYTYSDGSTEKFVWKQSTVNADGHAVMLTSNQPCSNYALGTPKN